MGATEVEGADVGAKVGVGTEVEPGVDEEELALSVGVVLGLVLVRVLDALTTLNRKSKLGR